MQYNRLGGSGLKVSQFSFGSWATFGKRLDYQRSRQCIYAALDQGVNFIENAEGFARDTSERTIGRVIQGMRRESLIVASKVFWGGQGPNDRGLSRKRVIESCHTALERMRIDYLDIFLCHRPDPDTPLIETAIAMDILVRQGKVFYWGTSGWSHTDLEALYQVCKQAGLVEPQLERAEYNALTRDNVERNLAPLCRARGLGIAGWGSAMYGLLTDATLNTSTSAHRPRFTERERTQAASIRALASDLGCTTSQLAHAWAARNGSLVSTVITTARKPEHVKENLGAAAVIEKLTDDVLARIDAIVNPEPT